MVATLREAILSYKSSFIPSQLFSIKLKHDFQDGSSKDRRCLIFNGDDDIEALLYVKEKFSQIASHTLLWTTGPEIFDGFEEVLTNTLTFLWPVHEK
jgi:hypothetical protein